MKFFNIFKSKNTFQTSVSIEEEETDVSNSTVIQSTLHKNKLEFIDSSELVFANLPVKLAKDVPVNCREHIEKLGIKFTFPLCPGMFDYSRLGYIVPCWADFHFKINKAGCIAYVGGGKRSSPFRDPVPMDNNMVEGIFKIQDNIPLRPFNLNSPWKIFSYDKDISALILPAWYHSSPELLENFYLYPGVVDYSTFHTMNVILAPRKKCEYTIKAGEPLLHVIPFYNKHIECGYGPPNIEQKSILSYDPKIHENQFYRKNHNIKKSFALDKVEENSNQQPKNNKK
jgi:hypothetical protein